jgi:hypothetical protein
MVLNVQSWFSGMYLEMIRENDGISDQFKVMKI